MIVALASFAMLAAACGGGSAGSGVASLGKPTTTTIAPPAKSRSTAVYKGQSALAQLLAYVRCMRSHGVSDFPDPTTGPGGGVSISLHGGPGSDLNPNNPTFKGANQMCRALLPGGEQAPTLSAKKIAAEVKWARCLRSHGVPSFPDPNGQGAFDSSKFDDSSPAFQTASKACQSRLPTGPISAVPGKGE